MTAGAGDARARAYAARSLVRGAAAAMAGRDRGADRKVRRNSYDLEDPRAQVFRPIGDGTLTGAMGWIDCLLKTAREYDVVHKKPGTRGGLGGPYVITVLEALLGRQGTIAPDFKTGRIDPSYDTLQKVTGFARSAIARALRLLEEHGFLDWVRRSRPTGNDHEFGPQREQTSNAYFFSLKRLPKPVLRRFLDLLARKRVRAEDRRAAVLQAPPAPSEPVGNVKAPADAELASILESMASFYDNASPPDGLYPHSGVKG